MNDVTHEEVLDAMKRYGGHFVKSLAAAWAYADESNNARLRATFSDYYDKYAEMAAIDKKRASKQQ